MTGQFSVNAGNDSPEFRKRNGSGFGKNGRRLIGEVGNLLCNAGYESTFLVVSAPCLPPPLSLSLASGNHSWFRMLAMEYLSPSPNNRSMYDMK